MARDRSPLEEIHIASPCSASWDAMEGGDRARFCRHCEKNVYNLSDMPRREAEKLVRDMEGRLCVRFYRRRDGTLLTDNCPIGLRAARRCLLTHVAGIAATLGGLFALGLRLSPLGASAPLRSLLGRLSPTPPAIVSVAGGIGPAPAPPPAVMGQVAMPPRVPPDPDTETSGRDTVWVRCGRPGGVRAPVPDIPITGREAAYTLNGKPWPPGNGTPRPIQPLDGVIGEMMPDRWPR